MRTPPNFPRKSERINIILLCKPANFPVGVFTTDGCLPATQRNTVLASKTDNLIQLKLYKSSCNSKAESTSHTNRFLEKVKKVKNSSINLDS